ncbi:hypothetical protein [Rhodoferax sp. BLA1]|uniref:hypothetical protein n=1 Tax=Rhodoferax sp. BLA1 TaxID=2576062 RepID=UPI001C552A4E|nr:hypothetical protein [Rhodoferax sp. BLA1]
MSRAKSNPQIVLRPQDVVVLLRLSLQQDMAPTYATLAGELKLTASEIHAGVERAVTAQLARKDASGRPVVLLEPLRLFVQYGLRYCFPATRGELTRGVPTSYAAPPMRALIVQPNETEPVWPHKLGSVRGAAFYPLYPTAPEAALANPALYELLVLADAVRGGSPRERALAIAELDKRWAT